MKIKNDCAFHGILENLPGNMLSRSFSVLKTRNVVRALSTSLKSYPINGFFDAKSYAIIGASEKQGSLGYIISDNFYHKFQGKTYFVNPKGSYSVRSLIH